MLILQSSNNGRQMEWLKNNSGYKKIVKAGLTLTPAFLFRNHLIYIFSSSLFRVLL
jgi:hypothetical protein